MRVAVSQSNYVPWLGYFCLIRDVDVFVIYDTVQYTKDDWRNRNIVITRDGPKWLTIPVKKKGKFGQTILETEVLDGRWAQRHWKTLEHSYTRAPGMLRFGDDLANLYLAAAQTALLHDINVTFLRWALTALGIETKIVMAHELALIGDRKQRLISICEQLGAATYVSAPAAKAYLADDDFAGTGIDLQWYNYSHVPQYTGFNGVGDQPASVLDALMSLGEDTQLLLNN